MLNIFSPVNNLGIGTHGVNFARALENSGVEISLTPPFGGVSYSDPQIERWLKNRELFKRYDPSLMIFDIAWFTQFCGIPRIGFAVFETDGFTKQQLVAMQSCDIILTPSEWGRRVLKMNNIEAEVVNEGYDQNKFQIAPLSETKEVIKFCHVGKFEKRKGTMQVLDCFFNALEHEQAELEIRCENAFDPNWYIPLAEWFNSHRFDPFGMPIMGRPFFPRWRRMGLTIMVNGYQQDTLESVYKSSDCGIFPSKGEGWGLPILECLATGVPAICGNWTGQSEYLGKDYPEEITLSPALVEVANDGIWYRGDRGHWIVPSDEELTEKIRWAYQNILDFRKTQEWAMQVARIREYSWDAAAVQFKHKVLDEITQKT